MTHLITQKPKEPIYLEDDLMNVEENLRKLIEAAAYWLGESDHTYPIPFRFIRKRELLYKLENIADEKAMERGNAIQKAVIKRVQQMGGKAFDDFLGMIGLEQNEIIGRIWEEERLKEEGKMHKEPRVVERAILIYEDEDDAPLLEMGLYHDRDRAEIYANDVLTDFQKDISISIRKIRYTEGGKIEDVTDD